MIKDNKIKILVAGHKNVSVLRDDIYLPIQVGAKMADKKFTSPWVGDGSGDNISEKNKEYCELTGLYWAWKNLKDVDYVDLCHYRRYFYPVQSNLSNIIRKAGRFIIYLGVSLLPQRVSREYSFSNADSLSFEEFSSLESEINKKLISKLRGADIVLPKKMFFSKFSIFEQYSISCNSCDFEIMIDVLSDEFGYDREQIEKITRKHSLGLCNMAIMRKEILDEYCTWLFQSLFKIESRISFEKRSSYQNRVIGFLGERMLHVWIELNKDRFNIKRIKTASIMNY